MENLEKFFKKFGWLVILILSLPSVWSLLVPGFFGASDDLHIGWLFEMDRVINMGQFPPRFVPDLSFGFGYPLFNFVFPLPFYIGELFHLIGASLVDSIKIVFGLSLSLSALSMFIFLKEFTNDIFALLGSMIYLYAPYRSNDVYNRGDIGESLSFVLFPLVALGLVKLLKSNDINLKWIALGGLFLGLLVLSHDIAAYMFLPSLALLGIIFLIFNKNRLILVSNLSLMVISGLMLSSYFWLPALIDSPLMKYSTVFNFVDQFPHLIELVKPYWGYGGADPLSGTSMSFYLGSANIIAVVIGVPLLIFFWQKYSVLEKSILIWSLLIFILSFLMMNNRSTPIWNRIPLLPYFQFPWRFLMLTTFTSSIFVVTLKINTKYVLNLGLILALVIVGFSTFMFRPHDFLGREDAYYINRYIPVPVPSAQYLTLAEEYLRLPKSNQIRPNRDYPRAYSDMPLQINELNPLDSLVNVQASEPTVVNFNKYNFPGWVALVDGQPSQINNGVPFGQISIPISAGNHAILVKFTETPFKRFLDIVSLLSLISIFLMIVFSKRIRINL